jgi:predicted nucleotidyltransferase component of viral defense system
MAERSTIMNTLLRELLSKYQARSKEDLKHATLEIIQEIVLLGLSKSDFFQKAVFYGGSALRIIHQLDRFSEDLDFSLMEKDVNFDIKNYFDPIQQSLQAYGFQMDLNIKEKNKISPIQSAFLKGNTLKHLISIFPLESKLSFSSNDLLKVKLELDTDPPSGASTETKYLLNPLPFSVKAYSLSSILAGKIHAMLCRKWKNRIKGRDFFDYLWLLSRGVPVDLNHLEQRLKQSGNLQKELGLDRNALLELLKNRFAELDFHQAIIDVQPFTGREYDFSVWSYELFWQATREKIQIA